MDTKMSTEQFATPVNTLFSVYLGALLSGYSSFLFRQEPFLLLWINFNPSIDK